MADPGSGITCCKPVNGQTYCWRARDLWKAVDDLGLKPIELPVSYFEKRGTLKWQMGERPLQDMAKIYTNRRETELDDSQRVHYDRIDNASLGYPIILKPTGDVFDGYHRLAKALALGYDKIWTMKFAYWPYNIALPDGGTH